MRLKSYWNKIYGLRMGNTFVFFTESPIIQKVANAMLARLQKLTINSLLKHTGMMKPATFDLKQLYLYTPCSGLFLRIQIDQCF